MLNRIALPLVFLPSLLLRLDGVYVHTERPTIRPFSPGPYGAVIDTGASHSWVRPEIGELLPPHSLEGYVLDRGDGQDENLSVDVKSGFLKGLAGKPVTGWVQLDPRLPTIEILLLSGNFDVPGIDLLIGMDLMCSFIKCGVLVQGAQRPPTLAIEY
jgi:hypothetical protein